MDSDLFTKEAREYRSLSSTPPPAPLEIQVLLTIPELTNNQVLVYTAPDSSRVRVEPTPRFILLERWVLSFTPHDNHDDSLEEEHVRVAPSTIYKHGIPLFRSLFSLLRILPSWKLCKRLQRKGFGNVARGNGLGVLVRVREHGAGANRGILEFDAPPSPSCPPLPTSEHAFPPVPLPMGNLTLTSTYLTTPRFKLDELESLLSSRFMSLDVGPEFTPTLVKNQQRDSLLSTTEMPSSRSRTSSSAPRSPPRPIPTSSSPRSTSDAESIAERFVLPRSGTSPPQPQHPQPQPPQRVFPITRAITTTSTTTTTLADRLRKESIQGRLAGSSDSYLPISTQPFPASSSTTSVSSIPPSTSSPISVRRPSVNPFKSGTVSERTSTPGMSGSPSSYSSSLLRNQMASGSPMSSAGIPSLSNFPRSSVGSGIGVPPMPGVSGSPIPKSGIPSTPHSSSVGSAGDRKSLDSGGGGGSVGSGTGIVGEVPTTRKRYSSSFGHRYSTGSGGSSGIGTRSNEASPRLQIKDLPPMSKEGSGFLSATTDDDDISEFVQDIDARKPLSGRSKIFEEDELRERQTPNDSPTTTASTATAGTIRTIGPRHDRQGSTSSSRAGASSPPGPMLTSESEVDVKLKKMNEMFLASLEGLGGGSSGSRSQRSPRSPSRPRLPSGWNEQPESGGSGSGSSGAGQISPSIGSFRGRGGLGSGRGSPRPRRGSGSTNISTGSEEVIGRLELGSGRL